MAEILKNENMPPFMLGTWAWGNGVNGSKMIFGKKHDEASLNETFNKACSLGFTLFDTAEVYGMGNAEKLLGKFISSSKVPVQISTKHMPNKHYKENEVETSLKQSCERLEISVPYIYWIHAPNNVEQNITEAIKLLKVGKIKYLGVSNYRLEDLKTAQRLLKQAGFSLSAVQNHFSLLSYTQMQQDILKWCKNNDVIYFAYMVLEQGALTGKYSAKNPFPPFSMRRFVFTKKRFRKIETLIAFMGELAKKYNTKTAQIPIAWARNRGTVPIIGVTKPKQVQELSKTTEIVLAADEIKKLEQLATKTGVVIKASWEA